MKARARTRPFRFNGRFMRSMQTVPWTTTHSWPIGLNDPRRQFAETLIDVLATPDVPIIVYSAYEQTRLRELAANFPDLSAPLNAAIARLRDLLPIVRSAVYLPEFRFSNSIKSVAPALPIRLR